MNRKKQLDKKPSDSEQELGASEAKYRTLFDSIDEGFVICELLFDEAGKPFDLWVLETNPSFDRLLRTTNAVGKRALEIFPDAEASWFEAFGRVVETGESMRFENYLAALDRWFDLYISRVDEAGSHRIAIVFNDITERKRAEERQAYLLKLSDALRPLQDPEKIKATATRTLGEHLAADRVMYAECVRQDGEDFWFVENAYHRPDYPFPDGLYPLKSFGGNAYEALKGNTVIVNNVFEDASIPPEAKETYKAASVAAYVALPLIKEGKFVALLGWHQATPRKWKPEELGLLQETAERTWAAVERARAEEALRQSEKKYRTLFDSIDEGFCIVEVLFDEHEKQLDYRFLEINASFEHQTGIVNGVGRRMREIEPRHEEYWFEIYGKVAFTGEAARFEHYAEHLGRRWYDVYAFRLGEPHERRVGVLFNDITKRKNVEEVLRESKEQQTFLLKLSDALRPLGAPLAIQETAARSLGEELATDRVMYVEILNADGAVEYVVERNYLATAETVPVIGRFTAADFGPLLIQEGRAGYTMVVDDIENEARLAPNERDAFLAIGIQAYITTPLIKEGKWVASVTVHQVDPRAWTPAEIALVEQVAERTWAAVERAKAEEELRRSEERLRLIVESAKGYAIFTSDADGVINSWNAGAAYIFGWSEREILGQKSDVLFTPEDRAAGEPRKELETARAQGSAPDIRWHLRKDGSRVFINGEVRPLHDGQRNGFVKIGRDLTAQRQAEEALREHQKQLQFLNESLEQKVQEKTLEVRRLASDMINATQRERERISRVLHEDLQQRLFAIKMQISFLRDGLPSENDSARKEASDIEKKLDDTVKITRSLSIDLSPLILPGEGLSQAIEWLATRMREQYGLPVDLRANGSFIISNEDLHVLLFNCVRELLFNVVKHAEASQAFVALEWLENGLRIEVSDNGKGFPVNMPEEGRSQPNDMPPSLGLPTIRHQLSLFGGRMEIHSNPGDRTQVVLIVPIAEAQQGVSSLADTP